MRTKTKWCKKNGAVRGVLAGINDLGEPCVDFYGNPFEHPVTAISTIHVTPECVGKEAILLFEDGNPAHPLLIGLVQIPSSDSIQNWGLHVVIDRQRLLLSARQEIVLRCGEASITLTRDGKVVIKGSNLLSKSTGPNRVKGGSVQLN